MIHQALHHLQVPHRPQALHLNLHATKRKSAGSQIDNTTVREAIHAAPHPAAEAEAVADHAANLTLTVHAPAAGHMAVVTNT